MSQLPDNASLEWLRKEAKKLLRTLKKASQQSTLAQAQYQLAKQYGFASWRALKAHVDNLTLHGQLFTAARNGDLATVNDILARGVDVNTREHGDNTMPIHWAAAEGHLEVVRRLVDAGADVIGGGEDHFPNVIGWAVCFDPHPEIADFLITRGATHHLWSAIALNLGDDVRRIIARDPSLVNQRLGDSESHRTPLHYAILRRRPEMVALLLELGADPTARDDGGMPPAVYANKPAVDRALMEKLRETDVIAALALGDFEAAARMPIPPGTLHIMSKRGDTAAVRWLLEHGGDPNEMWGHWDAKVTPLHLAAAQGHADVVRLLLDAGSDPTIRDTKHDGDAYGWAQHGAFPQSPNWEEIIEIIHAHTQT